MTKKNLTVRLSDNQRKNLEKLSRETKLEVSQLVRLGVDAILEYADRNGGKLVLPLNIEDTLEIKTIKRGRSNALNPGTRREAVA